METLIPVISKLQDVFATIGSREAEVQLPQIVVVGSQSAGKSSVIEGIVGRDFLPRGSGICTRRPLLLHLIHVKLGDRQRKVLPEGSRNCEWAEFEHRKGEVFTDFNDVRAEIEAETDRLTGTNKGISPLPIILRVYSHLVVNLSLIDLPGITKLAVGDQPPDIELQIRRMIHSYVANINSVILAVTPANQDFATSEPMKVAREVDPLGQRTIAVLTKLDLMDRGTDAMDVLTGKLVPVKLGIIGVVNRSQADIHEKKRIDVCLKDEARFLQLKYPTLASRNGTPYLAKTLNKLLMHHIQACLPVLKQRIAAMITQCQMQLKSFGEPMTDKPHALLRIVTNFANAYTSAIDGTSNRIETNELRGGARIHDIFFQQYAKAMETINPMEGLSEQELSIAMQNTVGIRTHLFIADVTFELLVKRQIRRLEDPCLECVDSVHEELLHLVQNCGYDAEQDQQRFPHLFEKIQEILASVLSTHLAPTKAFVSDLINIQVAYINNRHPEFSDAVLLTSFGRQSISEASNLNTDHASVQAKMKSESGESDVMRQNGQGIPKVQAPKLKRYTMQGPYTSQAEAGSALEGASGSDSSSLNGANGNKVATTSGLFGLFARSTKVSKEMQGGGGTDGGRGEEIPTTAPVSAEEMTVSAKKSLVYKRLDCQIVERLIRSYYTIIRKTVQDQVPKAIMHFLVNNVRDSLQNELVRHLYNSSNLDELLSESGSVAERRETAVKMLDALRKASAVINEVRETYIW